MFMTQNHFMQKSHDCIPYRGYYILTNHDDSKLLVTSNTKDILLQTTSLCMAYAFIDKLLDCH